MSSLSLPMYSAKVKSSDTLFDATQAFDDKTFDADKTANAYLDAQDNIVLEKGIEAREYSLGFPEKHYLVWTAMRAPFLLAGIPVGIRRSKRIRCHGHGGRCGKFAQDKNCRMRYYGCEQHAGCPTVGSRWPLHLPHPHKPI